MDNSQWDLDGTRLEYSRIKELRYSVLVEEEEREDQPYTECVIETKGEDEYGLVWKLSRTNIAFILSLIEIISILFYEIQHFISSFPWH